MTEKLTEGLGRLVPTLATGVRYEVRYGIHVVAEIKQHGRGMTPARWTKCSLSPANSHRIPEGSYFLHTDEGRVHQVKSIDGQWHYLAPAA